jgi:hypothetical protein
MLHGTVEWTIVLTAVVLWFALGWYFNEKLKSVHMKLDALLDQFNGLREYLYEIDPQFDDERESNNRFQEHMSDPNNKDVFSGMEDMELIKRKKEAGKRTLDTPFTSLS